MSERWQATAEMLANRVIRNERRLRDWRRAEQVEAYRVYDQDIPEVPVVVEVFGRHAVLWSFAYEDRLTLEESDARLLAWRQAVAQGLGCELDAVWGRRRSRQKGDAQYERVDRAGTSCEVHEDGLLFGINLSDYLDTGLFLDHRFTRRRVRQESAGKHVLNLFAYTGAFTVHAAAGGAASTMSVDLSRHYLTRARENLVRNSLDGAQHRMVPNDVLTWLDRAPARDERYDLAVVDPPTFSNSKRVEHDWVVQRDHVALLAAVARVLRPGGVMYFSTNYRRFSPHPALAQVLEGRELTPASIGPDFRDRRIHRCWRIEVNGVTSERLDEAAQLDAQGGNHVSRR